MGPPSLPPDAPAGGGVQPVHPGWRFVYPVFLALTGLSTVILYVGAHDTDERFAWTVAPPVSAAFLGAGYASGFVLMALTARERVWAGARIAMATVFAFTVCTLLTTLLHLDRFHFDRTGLPRLAAWVWLSVYVVVPVWMAVMFVFQHRLQGGDPAVRRLLPAVLRGVLAVQALVLGVVGAALLLAPARVASWWPWSLTPLNGRAVGSWLLPLGLAAAIAVVERDAWRLRAAAVTYVVLGVLQVLALLRFRDDVEWDRWATWAYLALLASMVVTGAWGRWRARGAQTDEHAGPEPVGATVDTSPGGAH